MRRRLDSWGLGSMTRRRLPRGLVCHYPHSSAAAAERRMSNARKSFPAARTNSASPLSAPSFRRSCNGMADEKSPDWCEPIGAKEALYAGPVIAEWNGAIVVLCLAPLHLRAPDERHVRELDEKRSPDDNASGLSFGCVHDLRSLW
jgi:hypothetical protein